VNDEYQGEIQKLSEFSVRKDFRSPFGLKRDCDDEYVDKMYYLIIFELMTRILSLRKNTVSSGNLKEQTLQYLSTGQVRANPADYKALANES